MTKLIKHLDIVYQNFKQINLKYFPAPILIGGVARQMVHVPQTLYRFWSQEIVRIGWFDYHVTISVLLLTEKSGKASSQIKCILKIILR